MERREYSLGDVLFYMNPSFILWSKNQLKVVVYVSRYPLDEAATVAIRAVKEFANDFKEVSIFKIASCCERTALTLSNVQVYNSMFRSCLSWV